ncbi:DNA-binding protein [Maricaulis sp. W15]|uniref:prolyl-tRNA synthetase associated domain-containing protein n=1 Tax=Maricaulis sp. W15 TaxID=1772333 RepID=UPI000948CB8C|nr:prolyl-tRNA synthetase associated domain-containing protein [Maricaulis sp. W15]OLF75412.1 DNA-binding protein [Maricaulis sp. W15]
MTASRTDLFARLDALGIAHTTHDHAPIFTVAEGEGMKDDMPGGHSKNLFLTDKKGQLVLVSAQANTRIRINRLHSAIGCGRLSFGSPDLLHEALGVRPGSVTAFALMNDTRGKVRFVLDTALLAHEIVNFHPLGNDATTAVSADDLVRFACDTGHEPLILDLGALAAAADAAQ